MLPRSITKSNLELAFGGESMAHTRYLVFSEIAEREGFVNVARLFRATAFAEQVHARNHSNSSQRLRKRLRSLLKHLSARETRRRISSWQLWVKSLK